MGTWLPFILEFLFTIMGRVSSPIIGGAFLRELLAESVLTELVSKLFSAIYIPFGVAVFVGEGILLPST